MTIQQLCEEISRELGFDEELIDRARQFANTIAAPGKQNKELLEQDLPEELIPVIRAYMIYVLSCNDPEVHQHVRDQVDKMIENN